MSAVKEECIDIFQSWLCRHNKQMWSKIQFHSMYTKYSLKLELRQEWMDSSFRPLKEIVMQIRSLIQAISISKWDNILIFSTGGQFPVRGTLQPHTLMFIKGGERQSKIHQAQCLSVMTSLWDVMRAMLPTQGFWKDKQTTVFRI